ncbi:hypothetical protein CNR22_22540 [Sphingobacteriaceae bacterium]|nr:hypothetical protein CNR22_22540 [Sphingobacteriaceae bacterium]
MRSYRILIPLIILTFSFCKRANVNGTVYTSHHIPIPHQEVLIILGARGHENDATASVVTDENGNFIYNSRILPRQWIGTIQVDSDSGWYLEKFNGAKKTITNLEIIVK